VALSVTLKAVSTNDSFVLAAARHTVQVNLRSQNATSKAYGQANYSSRQTHRIKDPVDTGHSCHPRQRPCRALRGRGKGLNEQVKRNARRFPDDFVIRLSAEEAANLRSQNVTSSSSHGGRRYLPNAFTEHGAIMAASVLNSERADDMSIFVVRAFVRMREALAANQQIMSKLTELEHRVESHDGNIQELIEAIRELMEPPPATNRRIGFSFSAGSAQDSSSKQ